MTGRIIANHLLEADEDMDVGKEISRLTSSPHPNIDLESEGNHWNVYKRAGDRQNFIGEIYYDDMTDAPVETMTPEARQYWENHRWVAIAGFRPKEQQPCASFEEALNFILAVHTVKTAPVREADEEDIQGTLRRTVDSPRPTPGLVVQNEPGDQPYSQRSFYVELAWREYSDRVTQPVVSFYDLAHKSSYWPKGQPISSYYAATLTQGNLAKLDLDLNVPAWTVDETATRRILQWLRNELETKRKYRLTRDDYGAVYEAADPDNPELYTHPERYTLQPDYEKMESELRVMLRPYYEQVTISRRPAKYADVFKGLPDYFTWTIHCHRQSSLPLARRHQAGQTYGQAVDWRKQIKTWFEDWAKRRGVFIHRFEIYGRLRKDPTFQFDTNQPWKKGHNLYTGQPLKENEEPDMTPEQIVSYYARTTNWEMELKQALWDFHPYGVMYDTFGFPDGGIVVARTYFPPEKCDFAVKLKDFVLQWLRSYVKFPVQFVRLYSVKHADDQRQEWSVWVIINKELTIPNAQVWP